MAKDFFGLKFFFGRGSDGNPPAAAQPRSRIPGAEQPHELDKVPPKFDQRPVTAVDNGTPPIAA